MPSGYRNVTPKSAHEIRGIMINNSNCDIPRKIHAIGTKYAFDDVRFCDGILVDMHQYLCRSELKEQLNMEISDRLLNKRCMKIHNNDRHLLICESGCTLEMIHNVTWCATKQKSKNSKNNIKYRRMIVWENSNKGIEYRMFTCSWI